MTMRRAIARDQVGEPRAPLDVHELGAGVERRAQDRLARSLRSPSNRPPSHVGRQVTMTGGTAVQRAGDVDIRDAVETQLDEVGARDGVARGDQLGHGAAGHGLDK